ncbi:MAG: M56 family metallopeptidase [Prolixibacteraceae bacterium]|nr:M56 family metallopeptidase [Prolixibacteraceae bacterium]
MGFFLLYIIKSSICLVLFYLFFFLVMKGTTLFRFNRISLLAGSLICLILPLFTVITENKMVAQYPVQHIQNVLTENYAATALPSTVNLMNASASFDYLHFIFYLYWIGFLVVFCLFLVSFFRMWHVIRGAEKNKFDDCWLLIQSQPTRSFSWGKYIVLSEDDFQNHTREILLHEKMHIRCRHTLDLCLINLLQLFYWFHPMVWLARRELQELHEFEADEAVINQGIDATQYQLLLVKKAVGTRSYSMASGFNHRKLKTRINMMLKEKTNGWMRLRVLLAVPVAAVALYVFAQPKVNEPLKSGRSDTKLSNFQKVKNGIANDSANSLESSIHFLYINAKNKILFNNKTIDPANLRSEIAKQLRERRSSTKQKTGRDELQIVSIKNDMDTDYKSYNKYLEDVNVAFEILRNEYASATGNHDKAYLDKICPVLISEETCGISQNKRTQSNSDLIKGVEITVSDKTGSNSKTFKNFTIAEMENDVKKMFTISPAYINVTIYGDKDCKMGVITDVKNALREIYALKINYCANKTSSDK